MCFLLCISELKLVPFYMKVKVIDNVDYLGDFADFI